ncbi:MAG: radical SAM/SPASM domain-containing protein [Desulfocapsaceae bacterium]|jgi:MoaA/NifB/PqqE/SkfB family radical SAM enzyme|nr:radical SAM/SPASM domain-containing protein [Desulfocapsaceae bacterium]
MLLLKDIAGINVEPSARCNAVCPFCSRNKKARPYNNHLLLLDDFKKLPAELFNSLKWLSFSGNFGDPCSNSELPEIAAYLKEKCPALMLMGSTNGSMQQSDWWRSLGRFYTDGNMYFSLDGLDDTHSRHRKGTKFNHVIRNIQAFTEGGGTAYWQFILFKHNEHQVDEAEQLAEEIGCTRFFVLSSREYNDECQRPENTHFSLKDEIFTRYRQQAEDSDDTARCKPVQNHSIYIAADGTVHPCCLAHCNYITEHEPSFQFIIDLIEKYGDQINFKTTMLDDILAGPYFKDVLKLSLHNSYCKMKCSKYRKEARAQLVLRDTYFK